MKWTWAARIVFWGLVSGCLLAKGKPELIQVPPHCVHVVEFLKRAQPVFLTDKGGLKIPHGYVSLVRWEVKPDADCRQYDTQRTLDVGRPQ